MMIHTMIHFITNITLGRLTYFSCINIFLFFSIRIYLTLNIVIYPVKIKGKIDANFDLFIKVFFL